MGAPMPEKGYGAGRASGTEIARRKGKPRGFRSGAFPENRRDAALQFMKKITVR